MSEPLPHPALPSLMEQAQAAFAAQDWPKAETFFRRCLALSPGHPGILHNLGVVAYRQNALPAAEALLLEGTRAGAGAETWLLLGAIYEAGNRPEQAFRCFKEVLRLSPGNAQAALALGGLRERMGDLPGARENYRMALAAEPKNVEVARKYIGTIWAQDPAQAVAILSGVLDTTGADLSARARVLETLVCRAEWWERMRHGQAPYHAAAVDELFFHYALPHLKDLAATLAALLAADPEQDTTKIRLGLARFCLGDHAAAEALFQAAPARIANSIYDAVRFSPAFYDHLRQMPEADLTASLPPRIDITPPVPDPAGVLYLACDAAYFNAFALPMLCSLAEHSPKTPVHLHVMDASPAQIDHILDFCAHLAPLRFALSTERPGLQDAPPMVARCYYHAVRFIRFYEHLRLYQCPLWLTDVDALVNRDLGDMFALLNGHDVAMRIRPGRIEPWNQFNACVLGAAQSTRSRAYHRQVAAYVAHFHAQNGLRWGIDQLAMYGVFTDLRTAGAAPELALLGEREVDYAYRDDGFIWCNSGAKKFQHLKRIASPGTLPVTDFEDNRFVAAFERQWQRARDTAAAVGWTL